MSQSIPRKNEELASTVIDGSVVIIQPGNRQFYWLNPVATRIWALSDGTNTVQRIAEKIHEEFDVDRAVAVSDTSEMVEAFATKQIFKLDGAVSDV